MYKKTGRNEPCPCGSGKKFKRCHGNLAYLDRVAQVTRGIPAELARQEAEEVQRQRQQGKGSRIISAENGGTRLVAIKNRFLVSEKWKTFHDFLNDYIKAALGGAWGNAEIAKPLATGHPVMIWYDHICRFQKDQNFVQGEINTALSSGAVSAYLHLAYDLYALEHNAILQERLLLQLKNHTNFAGARYEIFVAAKLIRAGFDIEFEDETGRGITHCEYVATYRETGKKFSVEVKCSDAGLSRVTRQLARALAKQADHERIVFIDINTRDSPSEPLCVELMSIALSRIRRYEADPGAASLPPAYVFLTNHPWHLMLNETDIRCSILADGFKLQEFKMDHRFESLRLAIDARSEHIEMHDLMSSMKDHAQIPVTFDGSMPEFTFNPKNQRLVIGQDYLVPDETGRESLGTLESAMVMESDSAAHCIIHLKTGQRIVTRFAMNQEEMSAWRSHPDTFFGVLQQRTHRVNSLIEAYDFVFNSYKNSPREKLIEFLATAPDFDKLQNHNQTELARVYSERMAMAMMAGASA